MVAAWLISNRQIILSISGAELLVLTTKLAPLCGKDKYETESVSWYLLIIFQEHRFGSQDVNWYIKME